MVFVPIAAGPFDDARKLVPTYAEIPPEFKRFENKWGRIFCDFFYNGARNIKRTTKNGIDDKVAWAHVRSVMGSWDLSHEHKEAAAAYLMSLWYEDITYTKGDGKGK